MFGYKEISMSGQPLESRNARMAKKVAKNRKKSLRKGKCSCSRCGRHQYDVGRDAPSFDLNDSTATFTLCQVCASTATPEEIMAWVLLHVYDRTDHTQEVDFETLQQSIEHYCGDMMSFKVMNRA